MRARALAAAALVGASLSLGACALFRPAYVDRGCNFNSETLTFEVGDARAQARCLLRHVNKGGVLSREQPLPPTLDKLVGTTNLPSVEALRAYILAQPHPLFQSITWKQVALDLDKPIARAWDNRPDAPQARYFVIHDTSEPYFADKPFPKDLNNDPGVNDLAMYFEKSPVAHFFVNRHGEIAMGHDFRVPWRATKREHFPDVRAKGLFVHIETVQPRRHEPNGQPNDYIAPRPGFTDAQYETLALLYTVASTRAHIWLVPGFHSDVDAGIPAKHDDPQHFDIRKFDAALRRIATACGVKT
jgi:hypothetical protein